MAGRAIDREKAKEKILQALTGGSTRKAAYEYAGVDQDTFYKWLKDQNFQNQVREAEARPDVLCAASLMKAAQKDWRAALAWLERRRSADWKERKEVNYRDLSTEQLLELVRRGEGGPDSAGDRLAAGVEPAAGSGGLSE